MIENSSIEYLTQKYFRSTFALAKLLNESIPDMVVLPSQLKRWLGKATVPPIFWISISVPPIKNL